LRLRLAFDFIELLLIAASLRQIALIAEALREGGSSGLQCECPFSDLRELALLPVIEVTPPSRSIAPNILNLTRRSDSVAKYGVVEWVLNVAPSCARRSAATELRVGSTYDLSSKNSDPSGFGEKSSFFMVRLIYSCKKRPSIARATRLKSCSFYKLLQSCASDDFLSIASSKPVVNRQPFHFPPICSRPDVCYAAVN